MAAGGRKRERGKEAALPFMGDTYVVLALLDSVHTLGAVNGVLQQLGVGAATAEIEGASAVVRAAQRAAGRRGATCVHPTGYQQ